MSSLNLPPDIDADPETIRQGAGQLEIVYQSMCGQTEEFSTGLNSAAGEFTDLIAWDITSAVDFEQASWESAAEKLTYGASTFRLWAAAVEDYRLERALIEESWTAWMNDQGEDAEDDEVSGKRSELRERHGVAWEKLMSDADDVNRALKDGPNQQMLLRLVAEGLLLGSRLAYFGDQFPSYMTTNGGAPLSERDPVWVNYWWTSMTEEEQQELMADDPDLIRGLDGVPVVVRDQLNREHLERELGRFEEGSEEHQRLTSLRGNLDREGEDNYLLKLDVDEGDGGRAIVAMGNPDTANNVGTLVPGTGHDWHSVNGQINYARDLRNAADTSAVEGEDNAVIAWIGYDPPPRLPSALKDSFAEEGAEDLSLFQEGLRATHEGGSPSNNTVLGHSYGSRLVGETAMSERGLDADQIGFAGSPGSGADHVAELGLPGEDVHTTISKGDGGIGWVAGRSVHGADTTDEEFGATTFESEGKHDEYFNSSANALFR